MYDEPNVVKEWKHSTAEKVETIKDALKYFELFVKRMEEKIEN